MRTCARYSIGIILGMSLVACHSLSADAPLNQVTQSTPTLDVVAPATPPTVIEHQRVYDYINPPEVEAHRDVSNNRRVEIDRNGFKIGDEYKYLRGGTLQFFKIPESEWSDRIASFKAAGFNTIDLYIAWNLHEPTPGEFDFDTVDLAKFLQMAHDAGLYIYLRPGPYFTNEWDGGGLPAWLFEISTKDSIEEDGRPNLRTADPDFLYYVERYFNQLNDVVRPYLYTNGGPIVLYSIENEYEYFEIFFNAEKAFILDGKPERPLFQHLDIHAYMAGLRDIVLDDGIDVPIATCPGQAAVLGTGNTEGVIPMPNIYKPDEAEKRAYDVITSMHDPEQFDGVYVDMPSGSTETDRTATRMKRLFMGGMDGFFAFNIVGSNQQGRHNAVVMTPGTLQDNILSWSWEDWSSVFISPKMGYFAGVIDYNGAITPSGLLREKFYHFRRANLLFDFIEADFAALERPLIAGEDCDVATTESLSLPHSILGSNQNGSRCHYLHRASNGTTLVSIVNESRTAQTITTNQFTLDGLTYPRYTEWTIPAESFPQDPGAGGIETFYAHMGIHHLPILGSLELRYSTSEILTQQTIAQRPTLFLYGAKDSEGELVLEGNAWRILKRSPTIKLESPERPHELAVSYTHNEDQFILLEGPESQEVMLVILTTQRAGRTWFLNGEEHAALIGPDFVQLNREERRYIVETPTELRELRLLAGDILELGGFTALPQDEDVFGSQRFIYDDGQPSPAREIEPVWSVARDARDENDADWLSLGDEPVHLEQLGIYSGHIQYEASVTIPDDASLSDYRQLFVESASDFVRISINGRYVTTVAPIGTEIDNYSWNADYQFEDIDRFLRHGTNTVQFEVTLWGHGSFMFPRGRTPIGNGKLPAIGFDAIKGLYGEARIGDAPLYDWRLKVIRDPDPEPESFVELPADGTELELNPGETLVMRTELAASDLASEEFFRAPSVVRLEGRSLYGELKLDGIIVGRWLSDDDWLKQGTWVRPSRSMWMNTHPDDVPLNLDTEEHQLEIILRDMAASDSDPGVLRSATVKPAREHKRWRDGAIDRVSPYWQRHRL